MRFVSLAAVAAVASIVATGAQAAEFVQNGGFESVLAGSPASFEVGPNWHYNGNLIGWNSAAGGTDNCCNGFNILFDSATATTVNADTRYTSSEAQKIASENYGGASPNGGNFMALDGDTQANAAFSQMVTGLTPGKVYTLSFWWAGTQLSNRGGDTTERLDVTFGSDAFSTATVGGPTHYFSGWHQVTHAFTATSSSQLLSFLSMGTPNGLPPVALLDGVSLTGNVPEPASWALLIAGFGLVGAAARRRKAVVAA
jgi:hypothetical protein